MPFFSSASLAGVTLESLGGETPAGAAATAAAEAQAAEDAAIAASSSYCDTNTDTRLPKNGPLDHQGATVGFYGVTPATKPSALTASNNTAISNTLYGATEAAVINNLRTRVNELETKLRSLGLLT